MREREGGGVRKRQRQRERKRGEILKVCVSEQQMLEPGGGGMLKLTGLSYGK